jgi:protein-disulfide isomerase
MSEGADMVKHRWMIAVATATVAVVGVALATTMDKDPASSVPAKDRLQIEAVVRDYILTHPEIIPEAVTRLREKQASQTYQSSRSALETPFASAWAGAEKGDVTMVMFSDYACGYCRASLPAVEQLLKDDRGLKVVWREIPILGPGSETAARAALAVAQQGAFVDFHTRMFAAGRPDDAKVNAVLRTMKIDVPRAQRDMKSEATTQELRSNMELVGRIDESIATPTFIIGGQTLRGAVGYDALKQAIADARKRAKASA